MNKECDLNMLVKQLYSDMVGPNNMVPILKFMEDEQGRKLITGSTLISYDEYHRRLKEDNTYYRNIGVNGTVDIRVGDRFIMVRKGEEPDELVIGKSIEYTGKNMDEIQEEGRESMTIIHMIQRDNHCYRCEKELPQGHSVPYCDDCLDESETHGADPNFYGHVVDPETFDETTDTNVYEDDQVHNIHLASDILRDVLIRKNADYGNSFADQFNEYGLTSALIRLDDKMKRLKNLNENDAQVSESLADTALDIAGYGLLTFIELIKRGDRGE